MPDGVIGKQGEPGLPGPPGHPGLGADGKQVRDYLGTKSNTIYPKVHRQLFGIKNVVYLTFCFESLHCCLACNGSKTVRLIKRARKMTLAILAHTTLHTANTKGHTV